MKPGHLSSVRQVSVDQVERIFVVSGPLGIGLRETIAAVRNELSAAMADGADQDLKFDVGPVHLEFAVDVTGQAGVEGGVKVWVLSLTGNGSVGLTNSHRISITLEPVSSATGQSPRIADREAVPPPRAASRTR